MQHYNMLISLVKELLHISQTNQLKGRQFVDKYAHNIIMPT